MKPFCDGVKGLGDVAELVRSIGRGRVEGIQFCKDSVRAVQVVASHQQCVPEDRRVASLAGLEGVLVLGVGADGFLGSAVNICRGLDLKDWALAGLDVVKDVAGGVAGGLDQAFLREVSTPGSGIGQHFLDMDDHVAELLDSS